MYIFNENENPTDDAITGWELSNVPCR
jgi:hypothetical protein